MSISRSKDLTIIIVNWNTKALLLNCLHSLIPSLQKIRVEIFVVDNASTDDSTIAIQEQFPQINLIINQQNVGFARGNNIALQQACGQYVLLLNPDTVIIDQAILTLYQTLEVYPDLGIVGAQLLNVDGSPQTSNGSFPDVWSEIPLLKTLSQSKTNSQILIDRNNPSLHYVDWVSGACLMIRQSVIEKIGFLDEDYWMYTEETDWCFQAKAAGWQVATVQNARVIHFEKASSRQKYLKTMLHYYQSRLMFIAKNRGRLAVFVTRLIFCLKAMVWWLLPAISPLQKAYTDLDAPAVRQAYRILLTILISPQRLKMIH